MVTAGKCRYDGFESYDVHELPVEKSLDAYDPHMGKRFLVERVGGSGYERVHEEKQDIGGKYGLQIAEEYGRQEDDVSDRGESGEYDLKEEHVRERYDTKRSLPESFPMLPKALECSIAPSEALFEEWSDHFWCFRDRFCEWRIYDSSSMF